MKDSELIKVKYIIGVFYNCSRSERNDFPARLF